MPRCPSCLNTYDGDYCIRCEEIADAVEECLEGCREDRCLSYDNSDGRDRCMNLQRPCRLRAFLQSGWRCPMGFHESI